MTLINCLNQNRQTRVNLGKEAQPVCRFTLAILAGVALTPSFAQFQNEALPTFDVASVKPAKELVVKGWTSRKAARIEPKR